MLRLRRFWAIFIARNKEFYRDRAACGWNLLFPFLIIAGFSVMFQRGGTPEYTCGIIPSQTPKAIYEAMPENLRSSTFFRFVEFNSRHEGFDKLKHHKVDVIIEQGSHPFRYWINETSPKGLVAENLIIARLSDVKDISAKAVKDTVQGQAINYIDWFFPGILAMNMMFSTLFGIGYVIVRYRKNGTLKRFKATPLKAFEYLSAQVASRLIIVLIIGIILYIGCTLIFKFQCKGSYLSLLVIFCVGSICMIP